MPLIVSPRQFTQRAQLYRQLSQLSAAGVTIMQALDMLAKNPPSRAFREPIRAMRLQISHGATVSDAMQYLGKWVPAFDISLVRAAEQSGRLDVVFKLLANYYDDRARLLRQILADLMYPLFLFHFAIFLFPFIQWFGSTLSLQKFFLETFGILIPVYGLIWFIIFAAQGKRGMTWRTIFEGIVRPIPVLGTARHELALARLAAALEALINAGVTIIEAWEMAAAASGSPGIYRAVTAWTPQVSAGTLPSEAVNAAPAQFPELFANLYHSGEVSGQLDESLRNLHTYYQEEGTRKIHLLGQWIPKFFYFGVAGLVAFKVIGFYKGYFSQLNEIMK